MKITEESMTPPSQETNVLKETHRLTEREKLKAMNRSDKIWYLWTYYKFHILAVIGALGLLLLSAQMVYRSTFKTALHCIYINSRSEEGVNFSPLEEGFFSWQGLDSKDKILTEASFISYGEEATQYSYASMAKISALAASKELDVIIGDTETILYYAAIDGFLNLEHLPDEIFTLIADRLYLAPGPDHILHPYAIDLSGTAFASSSHLTQDRPLLSIMINSQRQEMVYDLIRYIFQP